MEEPGDAPTFWGFLVLMLVLAAICIGVPVGLFCLVWIIL